MKVKIKRIKKRNSAPSYITLCSHNHGNYIGIETLFKIDQATFICRPVLPRIMNFGRIRIPNIICIFKNDKYEYYSEFEKLFEYYLWEIFK